MRDRGVQAEGTEDDAARLRAENQPARIAVALEIQAYERALLAHYGNCLLLTPRMIYISYDVYPKEKQPMQVAKWGNSLAVRLPAAVVDALELKEGDEIEIQVASARQFSVARKPDRSELLKRLRAFRGRLPADFKFDRDEANER